MLGADKERQYIVDIGLLHQYRSAVDLKMFGGTVWRTIMNMAALVSPGRILPAGYAEEEERRVRFWRTVLGNDYDVVSGLARELVKSPLGTDVRPSEYLRRLEVVPV